MYVVKSKLHKVLYCYSRKLFGHCCFYLSFILPASASWKNFSEYFFILIGITIYLVWSVLIVEFYQFSTSVISLNIYKGLIERALWYFNNISKIIHRLFLREWEKYGLEILILSIIRKGWKYRISIKLV